MRSMAHRRRRDRPRVRGIWIGAKDHDLGVHEDAYNASFLEETLER